MDPHRKLAAIIFTDIAGYTALMQKDEEQARVIFSRYRSILQENVELFGGRIIKHLGDGSLVLFESAVEAVRCARNCQLQWQVNPLIPVRLGMHIGDIVEDGDDIYGDGVNIASRLESLGVPGSVLLSSRVLPDIQSHTEFEVESLGHFQLKNVNNPMEVYALKAPGLIVPGKRGMTVVKKGGNVTRKRITTRTLMLIIIPLLVLSTYLFLKPVFSSSGEVDRSIAVLPFNNMTEQANTEFFADGMMEDILTKLSYLEDLKVISRTSSMHYRNTNKKTDQIARELGVKYILEGSVQKYKDHVKIKATLINAKEDKQLWSNDYNRKLVSIFELQAEVANLIASSLQSQLILEDSDRLNYVPTDHQEAYELFLLGRHQGHSIFEHGMQSVGHLQQALRLDDNFLEAKAELANMYYVMGYYGILDYDSSYRAADSLSRQVLKVDPTSVRAHSVQGMVQFANYNWEAAKGHFEQSLSYNSNDAESYFNYSEVLSAIGDFDKAIEYSKKSVELNPIADAYQGHLAELLVFGGKYDEGLKQIDKYEQMFNRAFAIAKPDYHFALGNYEETARLYQLLWDHAPQFGQFKLGHLSTCYQLLGDTDRANQVRQLIEPNNIEFHSAMGLSYIATENLDSVFYHLHQAIDRKEGNVQQILGQSIFRLIQDDSRFEDLLAKADLLQYRNVSR